MTFNKFCAKHFIPFSEVKAFKTWLGKKSESTLPEDEWIKVWHEFQE